MTESARDDDPVQTLRAMWDWYDQHPAERDVLAQGFGLGMADPGELGVAARDAIEQFADERHGHDPTMARLVRATFRGLLIESVVTQDSGSVGPAFDLLLSLIQAAIESQRSSTAVD